MNSDISKILLIKLKHIGDVLLISPVAEVLHGRFPGARISVLVPDGTQEVLANNPHVHEVLVFDRAVKGFGLWSRMREEGKLLRSLRGRFDLVVEASGGDRGAILARWTGAPTRVGYKRRKGILGRDRLFTHAVDQDFGKSVVDSHGDLLNAVGLGGPMPPPKLVPTAEAMAQADAMLRAVGVGPGEDIVVFHATSRWMFKSWDARRCARMAEWMMQRDMRVVLTCSPAEKERKRVREILRHVRGGVVDLSGKTSLATLGALLARARLFVGVDSAPMHMAYAVGTPTVSLFGPSDPVQWAPRGPAHRVVKKGWACQPCQRDGCMGSKVSQCLTDLEEEAVQAAVEQVLPKEGIRM